MSLPWSLARTSAADTRSFEAWGINSASLRSVNAGRDILSLGFGRVDLFSSLPFDADETLVILRDGSPFFRGRITGEKRAASGSTERFNIELSCPWWYLENIVYQQSIVTISDHGANPHPANPAGLQITDFPIGIRVSQYSAEVITGQDDSLVRIDTRSQIIAILNYAIAKGAPIALGTIDPMIAAPRETFKDSSCAELIVKLLRWNPGHSVFWNYSVNPPAIIIRSRANRSILALDIDDRAIGQVQLNPRRDLIRPGVSINYLRRHQRNNFDFATLDKDQSGPDPEGIGALIVTIELYGSYLFETDPGPPPVNVIVPEEPAPLGIAATLYGAFSVLQFEGRVSLLSPEADNIAWLSRSLRILHGAPAWASATMDIQQVTQDLFPIDDEDGTWFRIELTVGPPNQLGASDLVGLRRIGRTAAPPRHEGLPGPHPPGNFPPTNPPPPPLPPHSDVSIFDYVTSKIRHFGAYDTSTTPQPWPPPPGFVQLGGDPPTPNTSEAVDISGHIGKFARRYALAAVTQWSDQTGGDAHYTEVEFDFRSLEPPAFVGLHMLGTKLLSKPDGTNDLQPVEIDLSGSLGRRFTYNVHADLGAKWERDDSISYQVVSAGGDITFHTLRIFTRA